MHIGSTSVRAAFLLLLIPLIGCDIPPYEDRFRATGETIALSGGDAGPKAACMTCHGLDGEGDGRDTPRLAGLDPGYLHRQMDDYENGRREHAVMRQIVRKLNGEDRAKVAAYYAALPAPMIRQRAPEGMGASLYRSGDPARGLAACATCHGVDGEGDAANPPLAGQPAAYLAAQLIAWRDAKRYNDPLGEMRLISRALAPAEVGAVSVYASALAPHLPADRAASPSAHRDDPRNDASAPPPHAPGSLPPAE